MTYENCERLAKHFREIGNLKEAKMYEDRANRRKAKLGIVEIKSDKKK